MDIDNFKTKFSINSSHIKYNVLFRINDERSGFDSQSVDDVVCRCTERKCPGTDQRGHPGQ